VEKRNGALSNPEKAWEELLQIMKQSAPKPGTAGRSQNQIQWLRPNRLAMSGRWLVQVRFVAEPGKNRVYFERLGVELGDQNSELCPGSRSPKTTAWTMLLEVGNGHAFWRFSDDQTLTSAELARRVVARLPEF
jgi:hypothetical protein